MEGNEDIIISLARGNDVGIVDGMCRVGILAGGGGVWRLVKLVMRLGPVLAMKCFLPGGCVVIMACCIIRFWRLLSQVGWGCGSVTAEFS